MEKNDLSTHGLKNPIQTGTAGDNLSTAFSHMKEIFITHWKFLAIAGVCLSLVDISITTIFHKYNITVFNDSSTAVLREVYGETIGNMFAKVYNASLSIYLLYPFFIALAAFRFHRFVRASETFETLPKRGFISWVAMTFLNQLVSIIGLYMFFGIYIGIVALISFLLFLPSLLVLKIIAVIIIIAAVIFSIILLLMCIGIISQIPIFSLFKKVYPIGALKHAINSSFSPAGSRKGGFWGLNLWHFVGVTLLAFLVTAIFGSFVFLFIMIFIAILPSSVPFVQYIGSVVFVVMYTLVNVICYFFQYTTAAVYVSENLAFGDNNIQEEIITRAER